MEDFSKTKLLEALRRLSKRQRKDFSHFARLPSLGLKTHEFILVDFLLKYLAKNSGKQSFGFQMYLEKNKLSQKEFNYVKSNVLRALYKYLLHTLVDSNQMPYGYYLAQYFSDNGCAKNYNALKNKIKKSVDRAGMRGNNYHHHRYMLNNLSLEYKKPFRREMSELDKIDEELESFYLENKLRIICEKVNRKTIINTDAIEGFDGFLKKKELDNHKSKAVRIYYKVLEMLLHGDNSKYYNDVKKLIIENNLIFSLEFKKTIYEYLMNACIVFVNSGEKRFASEYLKHFAWLETNKLVLDNNIITTSRYVNCVTSGLITNRLDWTGTFIEKYESKLDSYYRADLFNYNQANLEFHKGNFDSAWSILNSFKPSEMYYKINCEKLFLKILFEERSFDILFDKVETFKRFISRQKQLSDNYKTITKNFIKNLLLLVDQPKSRLSSINKDVPALDLVWFERKCQEN